MELEATAGTGQSLQVRQTPRSLAMCRQRFPLHQSTFCDVPQITELTCRKAKCAKILIRPWNAAISPLYYAVRTTVAQVQYYVVALLTRNAARNWETPMPANSRTGMAAVGKRDVCGPFLPTWIHKAGCTNLIARARAMKPTVISPLQLYYVLRMHRASRRLIPRFWKKWRRGKISSLRPGTSLNVSRRCPGDKMFCPPQSQCASFAFSPSIQVDCHSLSVTLYVPLRPIHSFIPTHSFCDLPDLSSETPWTPGRQR